MLLLSTSVHPLVGEGPGVSGLTPRSGSARAQGLCRFSGVGVGVSDFHSPAVGLRVPGGLQPLQPSVWSALLILVLRLGLVITPLD